MSKLISKQMLKLNTELHARRKNYGGKGDAWSERVGGYIREAGAKSYVDYGCGKGNLADQITEDFGDTLQVYRYDPVTAPTEPPACDFLTCNDVLEHIEPDVPGQESILNNVLNDIASKIKDRGLLVISQRLANKRLADGRNAHLIVEKTPWWVERLQRYFVEIIEVEPIKEARIGIEVALLVRPRPERDRTEAAYNSGDIAPATIKLIER